MKAKFLFTGRAKELTFDLPSKGEILLKRGELKEVDISISDEKVIEGLRALKELEIKFDGFGSLNLVGYNQNGSASIELLERDIQLLSSSERPGSIARCIDTGKILTLGKDKEWYEM